MKEFRKGDKIKAVKQNEGVWGCWMRQDDIRIGDVLEVSSFRSAGEDYPGLIEIKGKFFKHLASQFKIIGPSRIVVILRRGADDRTIRKALEEMGVTWASGDMPTEVSYLERKGCRMLIIYTESKTLFWSTAHSDQASPRSIRKHEQKVDPSTLFINTKPSVKQAVKELERYLS